MKKKNIAIAVATMMIFLGASTVSGTTSITQNVEKNPVMANLEVPLGSASIYGDGIQGNTIVDAVATKELIIEISNDPEIVDLKMSYAIQCDGSVDQGHVYLFAQLNGFEIDNVSITVEDTETGYITLADVEVSNGDLLTFEIGILYTNFDPLFTDYDLDIGGGVFIKSRSLQNRFFDSPLFQLLQRIPILFRLFT